VFVSGTRQRCRQACNDGFVGDAGRAILPETVLARMRKRRCFADTELDSVMLERERTHAQVARTAVVAASWTAPQHRVLLRLPAVPYKLPPHSRAAERLVRSWWTPATSEVAEAAASSSRSVVDDPPSKCSRSPSPFRGRTHETDNDYRISNAAALKQPRENATPPRSVVSTDRHRVELVRSHNIDSDNQDTAGHQSRRTIKAFDFSVESILAR